MNTLSDLTILRDLMREFTAERGWEKYHDPKSLILALNAEVGELSEIFQWLPADAAAELAASGTLRQRSGEEISDVLLYLVRLADVLDLDLMEVATRKMNANARKHEPGSALPAKHGGQPSGPRGALDPSDR